MGRLRLADARGCYALNYHGDEAEGSPWEAHARRLTDAPGPISELVTGYLAYPTAATRALLQATYAALTQGLWKLNKPKQCSSRTQVL